MSDRDKKEPSAKDLLKIIKDSQIRQIMEDSNVSRIVAECILGAKIKHEELKEKFEEQEKEAVFNLVKEKAQEHTTALLDACGLKSKD